MHQLEGAGGDELHVGPQLVDIVQMTVGGSRETLLLDRVSNFLVGNCHLCLGHASHGERAGWPCTPQSSAGALTWAWQSMIILWSFRLVAVTA